MKNLIVVLLLAVSAFAAPAGSKPFHKFTVGGVAKKTTKAVARAAVVTTPKVTASALVATLDTLKQGVGMGVEGVGAGVQAIGKAFEVVQPIAYVGVAIDNAGFAISAGGSWLAVH